MGSKKGTESFLSSVLFLLAFGCGIAFFVELFAGLSAPPAPAPETGVSAEGWIAFVKAAVAVGLGFVFGISANRLMKGPTSTVETESEPLLTDATPVTQSEIAYHAIAARTEDGQLTRGYQIGFVRRGTKGYTAALEFGHFYDYDKAQEKAESLNAQLGLSRRQSQRMIVRWCRKD